MVSMNETAPIYARDEFYTGIYRQDGTEGTYQTGQVIASLTLELCRAPESIDEPAKTQLSRPCPGAVDLLHVRQQVLGISHENNVY